MRSSSFITDIVKRHITLPVNEDLAALKVVLRDWATYNEHVPLQQKPTHAAEIHIQVTREAPSSHTTHTPSSHAQSQLRHFFRKREGRGVTEGSQTALPHVYTKAVPLALWTAVLPWEVQRGLSLSTLALPPRADLSDMSGAQKKNEEETDQRHEADDEHDPLGVVSPPAGTPSASTVLHDATMQVAAVHSPSVIPPPLPAPGMLFVMDATAVRQNKGQISFWSGAILQAIDVLFAAPVFAASVGPTTSFETLRHRRRQDRIKDLHELPDVQARFFPHGELSPGTTAELRVANFTHLDPFPHVANARRRRGDAEDEPVSGQDASSLVHTADASTPEARYVFETTRHLLRDSVQQALRESWAAYTSTCGQSEAGAGGVDDGDADIELTVQFSDALQDDIREKAQLFVQYVLPLENVVEYHIKRLNTPLHASAEEEPLQFGAGADGGDGAGDARRVHVWLSETESVWMNAGELAAYQADKMRAEAETPQAAQRQQDAETRQSDSDGDEEDESEAREWTSRAAADLGDAVQDARRGAGSEHALDTVVPGEAALRAVHMSASSPSHMPMQPLSPAEAARRSIGSQSPMLTEEAEGRPDHLAPSFRGRHDASSAQGLVVSANKLARYVQTRSDMPVLPPIDYDLFSLVVQLGIGYRAALFHFHPRILRDWRRELRVLNKRLRHRRSGGEGVGAAAGVETAVENEKLDNKDVLIMLHLVRDPSLQLPEDLITLVEAVADLKEQLHGAPLC